MAYRGIVISAAASETIGNNTINQVTVNNVGKPGSQDVNRIGILVQNNDQGQVVASHVTNAGVGIASGILGTGTYSDSTMARNKSGMRDNVVTDAVVRGYSVSFEDGQLDLNFLLLGLAAQFQGFDNNQVIINSPANNAVGLYLNYSQPLVVGFVSTGAKIGVQVENTVFDLGTGTLIAPVLSGDTITGPGMGVAGSIGILSENNANEPNSVAFGAAGITTISGFQTGIKVDQTVAPSDNKTSTAYIERIRLTGNATGVLIGSGGVLNGDFTNDNSTVTTGTGVVYPGVSQSFALYDHDPGGSFIGPFPDTINSGDVTLASSSTFASLITGDTGTTTIFSFNQAANYPPAFLPIAPVNGTTTLPNGATYPAGQVVQDGTSGELVIGNGAINGPLQLMFGTNSHLDPNSPANAPVYILDPVDISNRNTVELVAKVGAANQSKGVLFALADITGNLALWTVDLTGLNTTAYSTISLNLSGLAIPLDLGGGGSGNFDLSKVVGFAILGDEGLLNGQLNVPFDLHLDAIQAGSIQNSVLKVNGSVNLGGANFNGSIGADYVSAPSHTYTIIDNDGTMDAVTGTFAGIADGATVTLEMAPRTSRSLTMAVTATT